MTIEDEWKEWARDLCGATDGHRDVCTTAQRHALFADSDRWSGIAEPGLRWPGYLGRAYRRHGGLLSTGIIHTSFATGGLEDAPEVANAINTHQAWIDGQIDDTTWLAAIRAMYRRGFEPKGWTVGKHHRWYWDQLGENVDTVAYVNAGRCQWPGARPDDPFIDECLQKLPLDGLIELLQPRLVLSNSRVAIDRLSGLVPAVYIHQLYGTSVGDQTINGPFASCEIENKERRKNVASRLVDAGFRRRGDSVQPKPWA